MTTLPQTPFARADRAIVDDHRKAYRQYDADAAAFGKPVADYNAGFIRGWDDGYAKGYRDARAGRPSHVASRKAKGRR
jgi:hypothetical protein